jgi:AcrR family transcriptional regulator
MTSLTKEAIKKSFMKLLNQKQVNKITVKEIVEDCGINRNSFYYHFDDIPSLMEEIFNDQADEFVSHSTSPDNMYDSIMDAVKFSINNKTAILHVFNSPNRHYYDRYLNRVARRTVTAFFDNYTKDLKTIKAEDREAVVMHYKSLLIGYVFDWVSDGAKYDLSLKIKRICEIFEGTFELAIERCIE